MSFPLSAVLALPRLSADSLPEPGSLVACVEFGDLSLVGRLAELGSNGREIQVTFDVADDPRGGFDFWPVEECVALPADCGIAPMVVS